MVKMHYRNLRTFSLQKHSEGDVAMVEERPYGCADPTRIWIDVNGRRLALTPEQVASLRAIFDVTRPGERSRGWGDPPSAKS